MTYISDFQSPSQAARSTPGALPVPRDEPIPAIAYHRMSTTVGQILDLTNTRLKIPSLMFDSTEMQYFLPNVEYSTNSGSRNINKDCVLL
ncbi:hypothetical protein Q1695_000377 [Nippostrongylus brasiliensis]|nr:hypothetical protein Q1695_000377 [Nippostrongylus brasiliensis]